MPDINPISKKDYYLNEIANILSGEEPSESLPEPTSKRDKYIYEIANVLGGGEPSESLPTPGSRKDTYLKVIAENVSAAGGDDAEYTFTLTLSDGTSALVFSGDPTVTGGITYSNGAFTISGDGTISGTVSTSK